jgi:uncharacterized membrane protein
MLMLVRSVPGALTVESRWINTANCQESAKWRRKLSGDEDVQCEDWSCLEVRAWEDTGSTRLKSMLKT